MKKKGQWRGYIKFIADAMLGKLAAWMRIIGCDVLYFKKISGDELIEQALQEGRIILTRDTLLIKRRKAKNHFFIHDDHYEKQLKQVVEHFKIDPFKNIFTRCLLCNTPLEDIKKEFIEDKVPSYVYETQQNFKICPSCNKIYWQATHKGCVVRQLTAIFSN